MVRMLKIAEPRLIFCEMDKIDLLLECLKELQMEVKIFTFNGTKGDLESVENLFKETGIDEEDFL